MKYIFIIFALFFSACSIKNYDLTQTKVITIKTKPIKFSDLGYLRSSGSAVELELFMTGKSFFKVAINRLVCTDEGCMSKSAFNKEYLNEAYPDALLQNVLLASEIYNGENRVQTVGGFEQHIEKEGVKIFYKVSHNETYFKDSKNKILIKIKESK